MGGEGSLATAGPLTAVCLHRALPEPLDPKALLDSVVWSACPVSEENEASPVFLAPL